MRGVATRAGEETTSADKACASSVPDPKADDHSEVPRVPGGGRWQSQSSMLVGVLLEVEMGQLARMLDGHIGEVWFEVMTRDAVRDALLRTRGDFGGPILDSRGEAPSAGQTGASTRTPAN